MAKPRGYSSYRGRGSKGKIALAVLLVLVILAAGVVIFLQRNIVYDATGTPQLQLPWMGETSSEKQLPLQPEDVELEIQPAEDPKPQVETHVIFSAEAMPLTGESWQQLSQINLGSSIPYDGVLVTMKDDAGRVYYDSAAAVSGAVKGEADTQDALAALTDGELYSVARINCLHDSRAANADVEGKGLKNTGGYIFYDGRNTQWLDPSKPVARQYLCSIAREVADMGFDEILLTGVSYPTEGKLDKVAYGSTAKEENLKSLVTELAAELQPYEVTVSLELTEAAVLEGSDPVSGQMLTELAPLVDRIYVRTTPEQVDELAAATAAADETTVFVPILEEYVLLPDNGCLVA